MAKRKGDYVFDKTGSRCRERRTGLYADCKLCRQCPTTKGRS